ncbi:MAG: nucleotidyltransferase family protein [Deltaproteobacteria bacterium]|nr:nucleotidyltransferase family protein [Deltaproteobacteria bacterium]
MGLRILLCARAVGDVCRRWRVRRLALFGSVCREDFGPESDVDVLVEFEPDAVPTLFELEDLRRELSGLLGGRRVDLVTPGALHPLLRERIMAEAVDQYAA